MEGSHVKAEGSFRTTHWTVVLSAASPEAPLACEALSDLCRSYWYPLYAYIRRRGYDAVTAQDLTQEFFAKMLEKRWLTQVDPGRGKFRSWLLGVMNHFLAHEWSKDTAQKRGGGRWITSLDEHDPEERYKLEPIERCTPETLFERRWALALLERAAGRLRNEYEEAGKVELYEAIKPFVSMDGANTTYQETADRLQLTNSALKSAVHRLRHRFQELVRAEIACTVSGPAEVDEELSYLLAVIRGSS